MAEDNTGNITLSSGAIKSLESHEVSSGAKKSIDVDFTFQIERAAKNSGGVYNCTLLDNDSRYGGFLVQYDQKDGIPGTGDVIHVSKIMAAILPSRDSHIYFCKNVKIIRRAVPLLVDPKKLSNVSKQKSMKNYENSVYKGSDDINSQNNPSNSNNNNGYFDDSGCTLISSLTTFSTNARLYLKCKIKNSLRNFVAKTTKKDCTLQSYIFTDTKGDEIQATAFNKAAENLSKFINEGGIYEIKRANIQLAERAFNATKCDYKLVFNDSTQVIEAPDNGKFGGIKFSIVPLEQVIDFPIGKIIDVFGFVLDDKGFQEFTSKNDRLIKNQKLVIADDTGCKIDLTLWEPIASQDKTYSPGDLIAVKNCRVREFMGKKTLNSIDSTEIKSSLDSQSDARLRKYYDEHQNIGEYHDIQGETIVTGGVKSPAEIVFIKDLQDSYKSDTDIEIKDIPLYEVHCIVTKLNHSDRNYYIGCAKCHKKMETEVCTYCSCSEKKAIMMLSISVRDATSAMYIDLFGDIAERFFGIKGDDYENLLKNGGSNEDNEGLAAINERIEYHPFSFIIKVRENIFNEQKRYRFSALKFTDMNTDKQKSLTKMLTNLLK